MVIVEFVDLEKSTDRQTNKQTREPLSKGDSRMGLIAFHIQLHLPHLPINSLNSYF